MQQNTDILIYRDINTFYGTGIKAKNLLLDGKDSFNNNILNLLTTVPGERLFEPEFGSLINHYLFEPIDRNTARHIKEWIIQAMERWLPFLRIDQNRTQIIPDLINQAYRVIIYYNVIGTDQIVKFESGISA